MNLKVVTCAVAVLAGFPVGSFAKTSILRSYVVSSVEELLAAEQSMGNQLDSTAAPVTLKVLAGTYLLKDSFRIARSNVWLIGEPGAKFVLANNVNEPVIAIGGQKTFSGPGDAITNIVVTGLEIDGNKEHQSSEFSARPLDSQQRYRRPGGHSPHGRKCRREQQPFGRSGNQLGLLQC